MSEFPLGYEKIEPATWAYLSSLLMIGLFFKFNRVWSVRNLDLLLLVLLAPGLLMIHDAKIRQREIFQEYSTAYAEIKAFQATQNNESGQDSLGEYSGPVDEPAADQGGNPASNSDGASETASLRPSAPDQSGEDSKQEAEAQIDQQREGPTDGPRSGVGTPGGSSSEALRSDETSPARVSSSDEPESSGPIADAVAESEGDSESEVADANGGQESTLAEGTMTESQTAALKAIEQRRNSALRFERNGYLFLFAIGMLLLIRMLVDPMLVRRPLLDPNLASGGLAFIGCSLLVFLVSNVITSETTRGDLDGAIIAREMVSVATGTEGEESLSGSDERYQLLGPGYSMLYLLPVIPTVVQNDALLEPESANPKAFHSANVWTAKVMAILSQLAIVIGITYIGTKHFRQFSMGAGAAALYLMLPYTAMMTGRVTHALPAALIIWAIASYRRPLLAGCFIGMAMGTVYYPLFLLPLWISFYWRRGRNRFLIGFFSMVVVMGAALAIDATSFADYVDKLRAMFGAWQPRMSDLHGIWALGWDSIYRLPILAGFVLLSATFAVWPAQKNLGTLINCSCAVMIAVQFWHGFGGGLHMAWYLPLLLLAIFRPSLEDRVALSVLREGWRKPKTPRLAKPADRAVA